MRRQTCLWVSSGCADLSEVKREVRALRAPGTIPPQSRSLPQEAGLSSPAWRNSAMNGIIYLVGLIVVILAILSFLGLR